MQLELPQGMRSEQKQEEHIVTFALDNGCTHACLPHSNEGHPWITDGMEQNYLFWSSSPWNIGNYHFLGSISHLCWPRRLQSHFPHFSLENPNFCTSSPITSVHWENTTVILTGMFSTLRLGLVASSYPIYLLPQITISHLTPESNCFTSAVFTHRDIVYVLHTH